MKRFSAAKLAKDTAWYGTKKNKRRGWKKAKKHAKNI